jgi:uncharacterized membrane protein HdeD (DUF308 family)
MASITLTISAILAIIFGIIILIAPKALNYLVAIWFLAYGILQLIDLNFPL